MNNKFKIILVSLCITFIFPFVYAQQTQYATTTVNGIECYVYQVVPGEGLYSISKKFGISQAEINKANPKIQDGLKAGESILIPVSKSSIRKHLDKTPRRQIARDKSVETESGVEFILHTVKRKQTLFAISRKYKVSEDAIIQANPQLQKRKMQYGEVLRIPIVKNRKNATNISKEKSQGDKNNDFITHKVAPKETLYAISRQYNVTVDDIILSNPGLKKRDLQIGETLNIPKEQKREEKGQTFWDKVTSFFNPKSNDKSSSQSQNRANKQVQSNENEVSNRADRTYRVSSESTYKTHEVAPNETLYSISRKYNVSVRDIKALNSDLEVNNIPIGAVIKIPIENNAGTSSSMAAQNVIPAKSLENSAVKNGKHTYKIAYLLPFMVEDENINPTVEKFIEFYFGSLLAINNAKNGDINFEVYTFDTEKTEKRIYEIINEPIMQDVDLIIGPAYSSQIPILADFAKRRRVNTVIPFSSKAEYISSNPYLFQFNPDQDIQNDAMARVISNKYRNANILFVENGKLSSHSDVNDYFAYLIDVLSKKRIAYNRVSSEQSKEIASFLSKEKKNLIIYQSDEYKNAKSDLMKFNYMTNYDITVLGQYSWRSESGKKPKMIYIAPFKGNSSSTAYYEQEYEKYYGKMRSDVNPRWDLLGYDLTTYFLSTMKNDGFNFSNRTQTLTFTNGVQSDFKFIRVSEKGGFVNHQLFLIEDAAK